MPEERAFKPMVLTETPAALSAGWRCMELGYDFHWPAFSEPRLIAPSGASIPLRVDNYVPYIAMKTQTCDVDSDAPSLFAIPVVPENQGAVGEGAVIRGALPSVPAPHDRPGESAVSRGALPEVFDMTVDDALSTHVAPSGTTVDDTDFECLAIPAVADAPLWEPDSDDDHFEDPDGPPRPLMVGATCGRRLSPFATCSGWPQCAIIRRPDQKNQKYQKYTTKNSKNVTPRFICFFMCFCLKARV